MQGISLPQPQRFPKPCAQPYSPSPPGPQNQFPPLSRLGLSSRVPGEKRRNPVSQAAIFQPKMIFIISVPKAQRGTGHTGAEQPGGCWSQKKTRRSIACKVNLNQPAPGGAGRRPCPTATASIFQGYRRAGMLAGRGEQRASLKCLGTIISRALRAREDGLWHTRRGRALVRACGSTPDKRHGEGWGTPGEPHGWFAES